MESEHVDVLIVGAGLLGIGAAAQHPLDTRSGWIENGRPGTAATKEDRMAEQWRIVGDFVDFCKCRVPCPCTFGQPPTEDDCEGIIGYRIREGNYGDVDLSGLNLVGVARFEGNIWDEDVRLDMGMIVDERADERQREALQTVFGGQVGGWPKMFADNVLGNMLGLEFAPIELEIDDDLKSWRLSVPGKVEGGTELLTRSDEPPRANGWP